MWNNQHVSFKVGFKHGVEHFRDNFNKNDIKLLQCFLLAISSYPIFVSIENLYRKKKPTCSTSDWSKRKFWLFKWKYFSSGLLNLPEIQTCLMGAAKEVFHGSIPPEWIECLGQIYSVKHTKEVLPRQSVEIVPFDREYMGPRSWINDLRFLYWPSSLYSWQNSLQWLRKTL